MWYLSKKINNIIMKKLNYIIETSKLIIKDLE